MTSAALTPWWRQRTPRSSDGTAGGTLPTRILDWNDARVRALALSARGAGDGPDDVALLRAAHQLISEQVHPVYSVDDATPVSRVLARGRGSCSQRLAILEAVARASGIATRVRGLEVDGRFWYPRFPHLRFLVPDKVLLAWPQFRIDGSWLDVSELFGSLDQLACSPSAGFTNVGEETLFDALSRTAVDWDGRTGDPGSSSGCDLSARVVGDLGLYDSRDQLFAIHGQTLSWLARSVADPILGRWRP